MVVSFPPCRQPGCTAYAVYRREHCAAHCPDRAAYEAEAVALLANSPRLQDVNLSGVQCRDLDLSGREMIGCRFSRSVWHNVCLDRARLRHVYLDFAILQSCSLRATAVTLSLFAGAEIAGTTFDDSDLPRNNFVGAHCTDCSFRGSDLSCCRFLAARLQRVDLQDCNLYHTHFAGSAMTEVNLRYCNTGEAHL